MKHTEGDWWMDRNREILADPMGYVKIGRVYPISETDNGRANGNLFIASKELLKSAKEFRDFLTVNLGDDELNDMRKHMIEQMPELNGILKQLMEAIKKAES